MTSVFTGFTDDELWSIPRNSNDRIEVIKKRLILLDESTDNIELTIMTALRALDIELSELKKLLPFKVIELSSSISASKLFYLFEQLSIPMNMVDIGYNPFIHRLNVLSDIKAGKISFAISNKLRRYLFRLKRSEERSDLDFTFRSCGGNYLKSKLVDKGLILADEFSKYGLEELEKLAISRFETINNYLYSQIEHKSDQFTQVLDLIELFSGELSSSSPDLEVGSHF